MAKKIIVSVLIIILVGAVGVAAYDAAEGNSTLEWPNLNLLQNAASQTQGPGQGNGRGWQGRGQDRGNSQGNAEMVDHNWQTVAGTIVSIESQNLIVDTAEMGQLSLQLGRIGFADEQNVTFTPGDAVTILGFTGQNGTFEAGQITSQTTGAALLLRDPNGRPLWAGPGQSQGQGGGVPQAADQEWITLSGKVVSESQQGLTVNTAEMGQIILEMGPPWFSGEQGGSFNVGDAVTVFGFTGTGNRFQSGQITNQTTGQTLYLRDPNGRPLWAGGGQGGGGAQTNGG